MRLAAGRIYRNVDRLGIINLSGLHYVVQPDRLHVVSDTNDLFPEARLDGEVLSFRACACANQEDVTVDPAGDVYLPRDSGGIIQIEWGRDG